MKKRVRQAAELARRIGYGDSSEPEVVDRFRERCAELSSEQRLELFAWLSGELEVAKAQIYPAAARLRVCECLFL